MIRIARPVTGWIAALLALLVIGLRGAEGQSGQVNGSRLSIASSGASPVVGSVRLGGLGTTGGTEVLFTDANRDVIRRALARTDLPTALVYDDEANTFTGSGQQIWRNTISETASGADEVRIGVLSGTPRIIFEDNGSTQWQIDNTAGVMRVFTPGTERYRFTTAGFTPGLAQGYTYDLGAFTNKFRSIYAAELRVESLVAADVRSTIGGKLIVAPTTETTADLAAAGTSIVVKHNQIANGDRLWLEALGQVEFMAVTSGPSGSGPYTYSVTRNLDGSGANDWAAGSAVVNTGTTGDGLIEAYSDESFGGLIGPTIRGIIRTGTTYNNLATRWAIGNLNGHYGYASDIYGAAFGDPSGANITIDPTNGIRIRQSTTNQLVATGGSLSILSGNLTIDSAGVVMAPGTTGFDLTRGYTFNTPDVLKAGLYGRKDGSTDQAVGLLNLTNGTVNQTFAGVQTTTANQYAGVGAIANETTGSYTLFDGLSHVFNYTTFSGGSISQTAILSIQNSSTSPGYPFIRRSGNELILNGHSTGAMRLNWDTTGGVVLGNDSYSRGHWYPYTDVTYDLGATSLKWRDIYFSEPTTGTALFPLVSSSGRIMAKNDGLNGTTTCAGAQRVSSITVEFGIVISITCS
jgi:hypothetical protein